MFMKQNMKFKPFMISMAFIQLQDAQILWLLLLVNTNKNFCLILSEHFYNFIKINFLELQIIKDYKYCKRLYKFFKGNSFTYTCDCGVKSREKV